MDLFVVVAKVVQCEVGSTVVDVVESIDLE